MVITTAALTGRCGPGARLRLQVALASHHTLHCSYFFCDHCWHSNAQLVEPVRRFQ
jgi:hypothetical protein